MIKEFQEFIKSNKLIDKNDTILLAISGGIDSVVMLDLFYRSKIKFAISHCNFKLRLFESDDDEMFVRQLAHKYNVDVYINWCNTKEYADKQKLSIQEAARNLRYSWFNQVCKHNSFSKIAVAHHQDDNIETFFINLARGAGLKGLKGIPLQRDNVIRPLMFANRKQIEEYSKENMLQFREDSSNSEDYYLRNKIRNQLVPKLEDISAGYNASIIKSIENLNDSNLLLSSIIDEKLTSLVTIGENGSKKILLKELKALFPLKLWIFHLFSRYGFSRKTTDRLSDALLSKSNIGLKFVSADNEILIDREYLLLREIVNKSDSNTYNIDEDKHYITSPIKINLDKVDADADIDFSKSRNIAYFDMEKLTFPLQLRKWKAGDKIKPFGMYGNKLVSDILIDDKVDAFEKENVYVIMSGDKIIWVVGYRSSEEFKVSDDTKRILVMELIGINSGFNLELFKLSDS